MSSSTQGKGFTEVTHGRKKRKASNSPTLPSQPKAGSTEPSLGTPSLCHKPSLKNKIPVILNGVDGKLKNWRSFRGEFRQYHPGLKVSQIKKLPKADFLVISDSVLLQSESKIKEALGTKVKANLPKAFQTKKHKPKLLQ